ncbi:PREDICTED: G-type lectin S-receptor-like serine/threonine-protein kinase At4g11900 [Camelina sativa]|uniref:Receptor-like serine/threonine-protein kinase n=1 Tax=Camelina sativa TaxID=90675 RepID=A0ABM0WTV6_CAMSA|nr:PREDICTED: G-type lectin S-receptor-like serine/threonine-protein kinase At4g11900 [Camelina sativa]
MEISKKNVFSISSYGFLMMFLSFQVSSSTDTIFANQSLSGFQTIVSKGGVFELGFFSQGTSNLFYLGIWYKQVFPKTIVWVANRASPARYITSINLSISDRNLILYDNFTKSPIWWGSHYSTRGTADVQAVLLDNGNLVLRDGSTSSGVVLWQSFDNPSDTWLPGGKIWLDNITARIRSKYLTSWNTLEDPSPGRYSLKVDPTTRNSFIIVFNGSKPYWSSGAWDDRLRIFKDVLNRNLSFEFNIVNEPYITYSVRYKTPFRLVMDASGQLKAYNWLEKDKMWDSPWSAPNQKCKVYGYCGSFGICNEQSSCKCLPTFRRTYSVDSNDSFGSCVNERNITDQCGKKIDKFLPLEKMKLATDPEEKVLTEGTSPFTTCESACLAYCFCKAYAYDGNRCLIWTSGIFNLEQLDANDTKARTFYARITASDNSVETLNQGGLEKNSGRTNHRKVRTIVLAIVLPSVPATAFVIGLYCYFSSLQRRRRVHSDQKQNQNRLGRGTTDVEVDDAEQMFYLSLQDIMVATNCFSDENKLGEGGFGPVYKGTLQNGIYVAIKRLSKNSSQGLIEFKNEVVLIIKLQHKNLVRLLGYCVEGDEKLLIYEYMPNKSLDALLFDPRKSKELDWEKRMNIVIGTTKGLQYLHEDSRLKIIHRDLKASNILLDDEMNPKISDFGTARIFGCKQMDDNTQRIVGTFGYMSPEYALGGMISEKSDIYSFGVLLLEIISGKKATRFVHNDQNHSLISYAWESWCDTKGVSIVDEEALGDSYSSKEAMRCVHIALLCVQDHPKDRPTISQIVYMLSYDHDLPDPKQSTFTNVLNCSQRLVPSDYVFSINEATQSTMEGR